ncbi:hypothetical protein T08_6764 [Trichinella sp. T8]|nr:hypothetical protein T08_6764 [Trichinella sp. T8]
MGFCERCREVLRNIVTSENCLKKMGTARIKILRNDFENTGGRTDFPADSAYFFAEVTETIKKLKKTEFFD